MGEGPQRAGDVVVQRRQAPGRMARAQQGPAQAGDQRAGHRQLDQLVGQVAHRLGQLVVARESEQHDAHRQRRRQHRGQRGRQRQRAAPQPMLRQPVQANPGHAALDQPAAQRPDGEGQRQQHHRAGPVLGVPRLFGHRRDQRAQRFEALPVLRARVQGRHPEVAAQDAVGAQGDLVLQMAALQLADLIGQIAEAFLVFFGLLQLLVERLGAPVQVGALADDGGRLRRAAVGRRRAQQIDLCLHLGALGHQRAGQRVDVRQQPVHGVVELGQLVAGGVLGGLLLDAVLLGLQPFQLRAGRGGGERGGGLVLGLGRFVRAKGRGRRGG
ncbi:hypothetical protein OJJOAM_000186 [Cupriavidus sp. H18C1]